MDARGVVHVEIPEQEASPEFRYEEAFSRNLGWVTAAVMGVASVLMFVLGQGQGF